MIRLQEIDDRFKRTTKCQAFQMWIEAYGKDNVRSDLAYLLGKNPLGVGDETAEFTEINKKIRACGSDEDTQAVIESYAESTCNRMYAELRSYCKHLNAIVHAAPPPNRETTVYEKKALAFQESILKVSQDNSEVLVKDSAKTIEVLTKISKSLESLDSRLEDITLSIDGK